MHSTNGSSCNSWLHLKVSVLWIWQVRYCTDNIFQMYYSWILSVKFCAFVVKWMHCQELSNALLYIFFYQPFQASFLTNNKITIILSITCVFNDITLFLYFFCCELQFLVNEWFLVYHLYIDFCCRYSLTINLIKDQSQQHGKAKESATSTSKCFDVKTDWLWMDNYKKKVNL